MQRSRAMVLQNKYFWLSLLCHLLLFLSFSVVIVLRPLPDKKPGLIIPSYAYQQPTNSVVRQMQTKKNNIEPKLEPEKPNLPSLAEKQNSDQFTAINSSKSKQGVHLIGDKKVHNKLLEALGKALSAHLVYPKIAVDFKVRGRVLVGLMLHPDGSITEVKLVKSSNAEVLDNAALAAINSAAPVKNISAYLDKPKYIVVGVIFR